MSQDPAVPSVKTRGSCPCRLVLTVTHRNPHYLGKQLRAMPPASLVPSTRLTTLAGVSFRSRFRSKLSVLLLAHGPLRTRRPVVSMNEGNIHVALVSVPHKPCQLLSCAYASFLPSRLNEFPETLDLPRPEGSVARSCLAIIKR